MRPHPPLPGHGHSVPPHPHRHRRVGRRPPGAANRRFPSLPFPGPARPPRRPTPDPLSHRASPPTATARETDHRPPAPGLPQGRPPAPLTLLTARPWRRRPGSADCPSPPPPPPPPRGFPELRAARPPPARRQGWLQAALRCQASRPTFPHRPSPATVPAGVVGPGLLRARTEGKFAEEKRGRVGNPPLLVAGGNRGSPQEKK